MGKKSYYYLKNYFFDICQSQEIQNIQRMLLKGHRNGLRVVAKSDKNEWSRQTSRSNWIQAVIVFNINRFELTSLFPLLT